MCIRDRLHLLLTTIFSRYVLTVDSDNKVTITIFALRLMAIFGISKIVRYVVGLTILVSQTKLFGNKEDLQLLQSRKRYIRVKNLILNFFLFLITSLAAILSKSHFDSYFLSTYVTSVIIDLVIFEIIIIFRPVSQFVRNLIRINCFNS
eukprot:TRINITY_DN14021_c0_g1_i1.p1 TRINITY_DN14021_c0_g1~~TRINITY_DN14021_c0_g1_i1.p1  ORF type:complete len:168 (+),score=5.13 TRINITY_DN14021_c0_g1_i1:60-506(+)